MKYQHVIYNSSERNQSGSVGFGVRCATEGTSPELLRALEDNGVFSFQENGKPVTPSALISNPALIRNIVPTYFFQAIPAGAKGNLYALGRKIAVGFDYTFYLNGKPGRLGNYVVDTYIFDSVPSAEEFEILLEDAASGSNHFIPLTPDPAADNLEMREISLGHKPTMPAEEKPFSAFSHPKISDEAIDLLFAFIESRDQQKPLLVKCNSAMAPKLMAQLARLVPESRIGELTFLTNHAEEGKKRGINIVFINEYYTFEIFRKQWVILDLAANEKVMSEKGSLFRDKLKAYIAANDFKSVHNLTDWCMSAAYEQGQQASPETQTALYEYLYEFHKFDIQNIARDANLRNILQTLFRESPELRKRLDVAVMDWFNSLESIEGLWKWIDFIMMAAPIEFSNAIAVNKSVITNSIFESPETFLNTYQRYRRVWAKLQQFLDSRAYTANENFLSAAGGGDEWFELYPYFLASRLKDPEYLVSRMISDRVRPDLMQKVIAKEIGSPENYAVVLAGMIAKGSPFENDLLMQLRNTLPRITNALPDFFSILSSKIGKAGYDDIFLWQLEKSRPRSAEEMKRYASQLIALVSNSESGNPDARRVSAVAKNIESGLKSMVQSGRMPRPEAASICRALGHSALPMQIASRFGLLMKLFNRDTNVAGVELAEIWHLACDIKDDTYLRQMVIPMIRETEMLSPNQLKSFCVEALGQGWISPESLTKYARSSRFADYYYSAVIKTGITKPKEQLDYLLNEAGLSDDQAMEFLSRHYPASHEKILKSRQPNVFSKLKTSLGGLFGGKEKNKD